jgi:hypothetical protein
LVCACRPVVFLRVATQSSLRPQRGMKTIPGTLRIHSPNL